MHSDNVTRALAVASSILEGSTPASVAALHPQARKSVQTAAALLHMKLVVLGLLPQPTAKDSKKAAALESAP